MNHFSKLVINLLCATSVSLTLPVAANAATMYFAPDAVNTTAGSIDVVLPIDTMGTLPVPRGRIQINGNTATLTMIQEWQFDRQNVLQGYVLDTRLDNSGKQPYMRGVIMWTDGSWIDYFDDRKPDEEVITGKAITVGHVSEVTATDVAVETGSGTKRVPLSAITEIRSPRVYTFAIPTTSLQQPSGTQQFYSDARSIKMTATAKPFRLAVLRSNVQRAMDTGDWSTKKCVAVGTLMSLVELSQLAPVLAVPLGAGPPAGNQLRQRSINTLLRTSAFGF